MIESFSCLCVANTQALFFHRVIPTVRNSGWIVIPYQRIFQTQLDAQRGLINKHSGNTFSHFTKVRPWSKFRDNYSNASDAVNRMRPIIIITFGTKNILYTTALHFSQASVLVVMTTISLQRSHAKILLCLAPYPSIVLKIVRTLYSTTNGNQTQTIVSYCQICFLES